MNPHVYPFEPRHEVQDEPPDDDFWKLWAIIPTAVLLTFIVGLLAYHAVDTTIQVSRLDPETARGIGMPGLGSGQLLSERPPGVTLSQVFSFMFYGPLVVAGFVLARFLHYVTKKWYALAIAGLCVALFAWILIVASKLP